MKSASDSRVVRLDDGSRPVASLRAARPACLLLLLCVSLPHAFLDAAAQASDPEPTIVSIFPRGGQQGSKIKLEMRGEALDGAYAGLFDSVGFEVQVPEVKENELEVERSDNLPKGEEEEKPPPIFQVWVTISSSAPVGVHSLRLISRRGVSNPVRFRVDKSLVSSETDLPHPTVSQAQAITVPAIVNGRIREHGELDCYTFDARAGQELSFEIDLAEHFEPRLALYRPTGSWLDPDRPTRLLFHEERTSDLMPTHPRFSYRVVETGAHCVEVGSLFGKGGPNCGYQLRILPAGLADSVQTSIESKAEWQERRFTRKIDPDWIDKLWARTVRVESPQPDGPEAAAQKSSRDTTLDSSGELDAADPPLSQLMEKEPNDLPEQAQELSIGTVIEGRIGAPGDRDTFKLEAEAGEKLAFEIETPAVGPPHFNPRLALLGEDSNTLLSNVHQKHAEYGGGGPSSWLQTVEPKLIYTIERSGRYYLEVRDITSRYGNSDYNYRLVVRTQIPHVGAFEVSPDERLNLIPGQARKLIIVTHQEEGFRGEVLFTWSNLAQGVKVFPGADVAGKPPNERSKKEENFVPDVQKTTLMVLADADAPATRLPQWLTLKARPVVGGQVGAPLAVAEIPLMVIKSDRPHRKQEKDAPQ